MQLLNSSKCAVYLVTSPDRVNAESVERARQALEVRGLRVAGAWMNRVEPDPKVTTPLPSASPSDSSVLDADWSAWRQALQEHQKTLQSRHDRQRETLEATLQDHELPWWNIPRAVEAPDALPALLELATWLPPERPPTRDHSIGGVAPG
jgi:hypothetical protein